MGTNPRFAVSNIPNPSQSQFETLFPAAGPTGHGGYFISYPFTRYSPFVQPAFAQPMHSPIIPTPISAPPPASLSNEGLAPASSLNRSTSYCCHTSAKTSLPVQQKTPLTDPLDFSNYDIGNAVASGWNGSDQFAFDQAFDQLPPFPDDPAWDPANLDSLPDIGAIPDPDGTPAEQPLMPPNQPDIISKAFSTSPNIPPNLPSVMSGPCSHQGCCQHGDLHHARIFHQGLQIGQEPPLQNVLTPLMQSFYTPSPS